MAPVNLPVNERVHIDKVIPYWRNPRRLAQEAVEAVKQSIQTYGYAQPIVVDEKYVIIVGHTRYAAMRQMGATELEIVKVDYLTPVQVKQLRVVDNRSGEYSSWDFEKLVQELENTESELMKGLFPEASMDSDDELPQSTVIVRDPENLQEADMAVEFVCPTCFHEWEAELTRDQIMSGTITPQEN